MADGREWVERALAGADPTAAARIRSDEKLLAYLDKAMQGIKDDTKMEVLRVLLNLEIKPDDQVNLLLALYGHLRAAGDVIPNEIREATRDLGDMTDRFSEECEMFPELLGRHQQRIMEDTEKQAREIAASAVKAQSVEEIEKHRIRVTTVTEDAMRIFLDNAMKEKRNVAGDSVRALSIGGAIATVILVAGMFIGGTFTSVRESGMRSDALYGRELLQMWGDMSPSMRTWVKDWTQTHEIK